MRDVLRPTIRVLLASLWYALCCAALPGCFASHGGPKDSTETGNPPAIDSKLLSLEVSADEVHIVGEKGAASPGGSTIEITNLATGAVTKAKSAADGSFDVQVDGSPDEAFSLTVSSGGASSTPVYVVRGDAVVGSGSDGSLSCAQREQLAGAELQLAVTNADKACMVDADCQVVLQDIHCNTNALCGSAVVSQAGQRAIAATTAAINMALCNGEGGCTAVAASCALAQPVAVCAAGQCQAIGGTQNPSSLSCAEREQMAGDQIAAAIAAADNSCTADADCVAAAAQTACHDSCGPVVTSQAGAAAIAAAVDRINNDVCGKFSGDGCIYTVLPCMPPLAGTPACMSGRCALAQPGACPPDRKLATICTMCGPAGGCASTVQTCAKVCGTNGDCAGDSNGQFCSAQQVCEQGGCI